MSSRLSLVFVIAVFAGCSNLTEANPDPTLSLGATATDGTGSDRIYEVTITNLTSGQPLSPAALVVHGASVSVFSVGATASEGIRRIAEDGDPSYLVAMMAGGAHVADAKATTAPVHRIGGPGPTSVTTMVRASGGANRLSLATMLICTNDGFVGLHGVKLPSNFKPATFNANAYDSGTEANSELDGDIVPPCFGIGPVGGTGGGGRTPTAGVIRMHRGIVGGNALTSAHAWRESPALVTVVRIQ